MRTMRGDCRQKKNRRRGFSLMEVVFAIFLLATGAGVVVATLPIANTSRAKADMENKAVGLAQKELEAIRGVGYANINPTQLKSYGLIDSTTSISDNTYSFTNSDSAQNDDPALILPNCTASVTINQADIDLRQVIVTVNWVDRGVNRSFTVGTLVANL